MYMVAGFEDVIKGGDIDVSRRFLDIGPNSRGVSIENVNLSDTAPENTYLAIGNFHNESRNIIPATNLTAKDRKVR
jgi:hypothetical protein